MNRQAACASQDAISWLSRAIVELHEDSFEAPTSLAETIARLLAVWILTRTGRPSHRSSYEMPRTRGSGRVHNRGQRWEHMVGRNHDHIALEALDPGSPHNA